MNEDGIGLAETTLRSAQVGPVNKHGSVTQVKNGFVFYAGGNTFVAYTFEELTKFLQEYFV